MPKKIVIAAAKLRALGLSRAQYACLCCIAEHGDIEAFYTDGGYGDYWVSGKAAHSALWFNAADKVTDSLLRRGLCTSDGRLGASWELTDAGRELHAAAAAAVSTSGATP